MLMIQPIIVTSQEPDGQIVQQTQYQIIRQPDDSDVQSQLIQVALSLHSYVLITEKKLQLIRKYGCKSYILKGAVNHFQ